MALRDIEELMRNVDSLDEDEMLELAQRLIARARSSRAEKPVDLNALAGCLTLAEEPMAIQDRLRSEWQ